MSVVIQPSLLPNPIKVILLLLFIIIIIIIIIIINIVAQHWARLVLGWVSVYSRVHYPSM